MGKDEDPEVDSFRKVQTQLIELQNDVLKFSAGVNARLNSMLFSIDEVLPNEESKIVGTPKTEYGNSFWQVVGLLSSPIEFKTKAELARHVISDKGKAISRQRLQSLLDKVIKEGLAVDPFTKKEGKDN